MSEEYERVDSRSDTGRRRHDEAPPSQQHQGNGRGTGNGAKEPVRGYQELRVYQGAMEAAMRVFEMTKGFPAEERLSIVAQMRRSSRSVCTGIGEAWRRRKTQAHFVSKLSDSEGEAEETRVWVDLATRCRYLSQEDAKDLADRYDKILAQLVKMISEPERWTIRPPQA